MAIGRLLLPKLTPRFSCRGFVPLTRRWISSSMEDGRKVEKVPPDSNASTNKAKEGMHWYSFGGLLTNLKQKITGNMLLLNKTSGEDSVSPKSPVVSSEDSTGTKFVSSWNVPENENCSPPSVKEESLATEMGSSSAGIEILGKSESTSADKETLDSNSLGGSELLQNKVLRLITAERMDLPEEPSSKEFSPVLLTEEASESLASSVENQGKLQPDKGGSTKKESPQKKLSNMFMDLDEKFKLPLRFEAPSNSNSSTYTGKSCTDRDAKDGLIGKMLSDPVQKIEKFSKENNKHRFSDALQSSDILSWGACHDQKRGDLAAIRERKITFPFGNSRKPSVPVTVSRDLSMKKVMEALHPPTDNGVDAYANSWNNEAKGISKGSFVTEKSESFCVKEKEKSEDESLVMKEQSFCTQATLATTTTKSLNALSVGEHLPNKVLLRFLIKTVEKKDIVEGLSAFGAVSDVQEIPSFQGCIYRDALVTFSTNSTVMKALKKDGVMLKHNRHPVVIESTSQEDMVEKIHIPDLIGDPDVPIALVKEPIRTVKIHPLSHDISSNQIKEALKFCRSGISKVILGSSKTVFVEFEREEGKERALAAHSISIFNKQLFISRIDTPRTTVARISNLSESAKKDILKLCVPYGQVKQVFHRGMGIADVYFKFSEWPNMLTILNSLNGKEVDGLKWVVQPATAVIPHQILKVLWENPQGKRYVKGVIQNLVREIEKPLDATRSYTLVSDLVL